MSLAHDQEDGPITVIVTRTAKKGRIKEFEEWMDGIVHESLKFEGHLGVGIIRPIEQSKPEYVIIFRFNTLNNLLKWERSQARKEWLEKSKDVVEGEDKVQKLTGLELWFTPRSIHRTEGEANNNEARGQPVNLPPRYKMAIVTAGIVFVLLNTLIPQIEQLTAPLPLLLQYSRCIHHGISYDIFDNAICHKVIEALVIQEEISMIIVYLAWPF